MALSVVVVYIGSFCFLTVSSLTMHDIRVLSHEESYWLSHGPWCL